MSFTAPGTGLKTDRIDRLAREREGIAKPAEGPDSLRFTCCGEALPGYEIEIRDPAGSPCADGVLGSIFLRSPSTAEGTSRKRARPSSPHGAWLDTGDLGYLRAGTLVVTGRRKDLSSSTGAISGPDLELTAERSAEGRTGDAAAFTVEGPEHDELVVSSNAGSATKISAKCSCEPFVEQSKRPLG